MRTLPKISLFEPKKKSIKTIAMSKRRRRRRLNYSHIALATDLEKKLQWVLKMCPNGQNCFFLNQQKRIVISKNRRGKTINYSQIDLATDSGKKAPLCAKNVPKRLKELLFEPKEKSKKRIVISKLALQ